MKNWTRSFGAVCLAGLLAHPAESTAAAQGQVNTTYSGRSFALMTRNFLQQPVYVADSGELPPEGGVVTAGVLSASVQPAAQAEVLVAWSAGANGGVRSSASAGKVLLLPGHLAEVRADFARAAATVDCARGHVESEIAGLVFAGVSVQVTGQPNQTISIPGVGKLVINEQILVNAPGSHMAKVIALHLTVTGVADLMVAHAEAGIDCERRTPEGPCHDFATGGGFLLQGGKHVNFGFHAGFHAGAVAPTAQFDLIDHSTGMHMEATTITVYNVGPTPTSRHLEGLCRIDGAAGYHYSIDVADNGEPGQGLDFLSVALSNGFFASGQLAGGNIQIHEPCF